MKLASITPHPTESFMNQVARNLTDSVDGFLRGHCRVICDRDTKCTEHFEEILRAAGVEVVVTPYQAPNCNAYAERFVLSIKSECLDRMILFGARRLRYAVESYVEHYNCERPHQGIGNVPLSGEFAAGAGRVRCHERLGGLLKHDSRAAA